MQVRSFLAVAGLLAASVEAAPRPAVPQVQQNAKQQVGTVPDQIKDLAADLPSDLSKQEHKRAMKHSASSGDISDECPAGSTVVSITTVDVTVYVSATPASSTEPCPEEILTTTKAISTMTKTLTTATGASKSSKTAHKSMSETNPDDSGEASSTPCPEESGYYHSGDFHNSQSGMKSGMGHRHTDATASSHTATSAYKKHTATTESFSTCVIDTSMTPVSTATTTVRATKAIKATKTVYVSDKPTGTPAQDCAYCGIHGKPVGDYFLAEFVEDRSGVPVTLEGCYQFCDSVMEATKGCQAYRFYHNELGAPRCELYSMPVSRDVEDVDDNQPDVWYDLACGSPSGHGSSSGGHSDSGKHSGNGKGSDNTATGHHGGNVKYPMPAGSSSGHGNSTGIVTGGGKNTTGLTGHGSHSGHSHHGSGSHGHSHNSTTSNTHSGGHGHSSNSTGGHGHDESTTGHGHSGNSTSIHTPPSSGSSSGNGHHSAVYMPPSSGGHKTHNSTDDDSSSSKHSHSASTKTQETKTSSSSHKSHHTHASTGRESLTTDVMNFYIAPTGGVSSSTETASSTLTSASTRVSVTTLASTASSTSSSTSTTESQSVVYPTGSGDSYNMYMPPSRR